MNVSSPRISFVVVLVAISGATVFGREWMEEEPIVSPDGRSKVDIRYGERSMGTEWEVTWRRKGRVLYRRVLPDTLDVRYVKASWSPSSRALLLGENQRSAMDLTLLRLVGNRVLLKHFEVGDQVFSREKKELPLHPDLQSSAGGSRVTWSTVRWLSPTRCTMLYIIWGYGYAGEADVIVDFRGGRASVRVSHLRALAHPEYFQTD
jgi:hypothetical protein